MRDENRGISSGKGGRLKHPLIFQPTASTAAVTLLSLSKSWKRSMSAHKFGSGMSILDHKLDQKPARKRAAETAPILHQNIRGARYYTSLTPEPENPLG